MKIKEFSQPHYYNQSKTAMKPNRSIKEGQSPSASVTMSVAFSETRQRIQDCVEEIKGMDVEKNQRLLAVKNEIQNGTYEIVPSAISASLMNYLD